MGTEHLKAAQRRKDSNYYTQLEDVEQELKHYWEFLRGKSVLCNCDDICSAFGWYFMHMFEKLQLKKLVLIKYNENRETSRAWIKEQWGGSPDAGLYFVHLTDDGDFRGASSLRYLLNCDVVVTNPPFHLSSEFVKLLFRYNKDFIIMGNPNKQTDKFVFTKLRDGEMQLGLTVDRQLWFHKVPIGEFSDNFGLKYEDVEKFPLVPSSASWYTTFPVNRGLRKLECWRSYYENPDFYQRYDNCDAIHIKKIQDIPYDYEGVMGVPVTFWERYDVSDFEVVGASLKGMFEQTKVYCNPVRYNQKGDIVRDSVPNGHLVIRLANKPSQGCYYSSKDCEEYLIEPYMRILIKRKAGVSV